MPLAFGGALAEASSEFDILPLFGVSIAVRFQSEASW